MKGKNKKKQLLNKARGNLRKFNLTDEVTERKPDSSYSCQQIDNESKLMMMTRGKMMTFRKGN